MTTVLVLFALISALGAFDTLYYHEYRARLPSSLPGTRDELLLHGARDMIYTVLFATLPWLSWRGVLAYALAAMMLCEVVITITDFVVEDRTRKPMGGVYPGERAMHTVMAIGYGATIATFAPILIAWSHEPTGFATTDAAVPALLRWALNAGALGVFLSGIRDLVAALHHADAQT